MEKTAFITGVTGQDGTYLAEFLLAKGIPGACVKRRSSSFNTARIDHLYHDPHEENVRFFLHYGDLTDPTNIIRLIQETRPTEIYNLAAQSHVQVSFETPEYTANADALGALRGLEAIRILGLKDRVRFYQASTSEMFGNAPPPQDETTPFHPRSPVRRRQALRLLDHRELPGKLRAFHATNGILFNHESPPPRRDLRHPQDHPGRRRHRDGAAGQASISATSTPGATGAMPADYVEGMWLMLQQDEPDDYVLATGEAHSVARVLSSGAFARGRAEPSTGAAYGRRGREAYRRRQRRRNRTGAHRPCATIARPRS